MNVIYTDVLVIGGGLAGLRMAVAAKRRGHDAIILSLVPPKRSHSKAAQGGMQASLGNVIKGQGDNEDVHFEDTVRGSDWGADQDVVRMFVNTAPKAVRELAAWGVPWSRVRKGDRQVVINGQKVTITERDEAHGLVAQRDFGGTKKWRTCYVADATGHAMLQAVGDQVIASLDPGARAHRGTGADPRGRPLLRRGRARSDHRRTDSVRRQGDRARDRRRRASLPGHDQCRDLRRHRHGDRAGNRHRHARQHGGGAVPPDTDLPGRHPADRGLPRRRRSAARRRSAPLHAGLRAREEGTGLARRRVAPDGRAHQEGQGREVALRRAHLAGHPAARRSTTSSTTCARSGTSATTSSASIRSRT